MMKFKFVGAYDGVTGSCSWLWHTDSDTQLLVDCGLHQGTHEQEWRNHKPFTFDPAKIQYVILTHAHIDHCGLIPKLIQEGFRGWVYCTDTTREVAIEMLSDSANISKLYSLKDIKGIRWHSIDKIALSWNRKFRLADGLTVTFNRSSHVLGACAASITWAKQSNDGQTKLTSIHFSGDVGNQRDSNQYLPLMKSEHNPYPSVSYIVCEATYGDRQREPHCWEQRVEALRETIFRTLHLKKGKVLIPTFAFHRMQELIADLCALKLIPDDGARYPFITTTDIRVLCHSELGRKINAIYARQLARELLNGKSQYLNDGLARRLSTTNQTIFDIYGSLGIYDSASFSGIEYRNPLKPAHSHSDHNWEKNISESDVILATSGMCDKGPSARYLEELINDPRNTIILTGYQSAGSAGRALLGAQPNSSRAEVVDMSSYYSGHADQRLLLDYLLDTQSFKHQETGTTIFINHGETAAKEELKNRLLSENAHNGSRTIKDVHIGKDCWFDLDCGVYLSEDNPAIEDEITRLRNLLSEAGIQH